MSSRLKALGFRETPYSLEPTAFDLIGGPERDRTADLMLAKHALSQLSYRPKFAKQI